MKTATEILIQAMEELGDSPHAKVLVLIDDAGEDAGEIRRLGNAPYMQGLGMLMYALQREKSKIPDATE